MMKMDPEKRIASTVQDTARRGIPAKHPTGNSEPAVACCSAFESMIAPVLPYSAHQPSPPRSPEGAPARILASDPPNLYLTAETNTEQTDRPDRKPPASSYANHLLTRRTQESCPRMPHRALDPRNGCQGLRMRANIPRATAGARIQKSVHVNNNYCTVKSPVRQE